MWYHVEKLGPSRLIRRELRMEVHFLVLDVTKNHQNMNDVISQLQAICTEATKVEIATWSLCNERERRRLLGKVLRTVFGRSARTSKTPARKFAALPSLPENAMVKHDRRANLFSSMSYAKYWVRFVTCWVMSLNKEPYTSGFCAGVDQFDLPKGNLAFWPVRVCLAFFFYRWLL